MRWASSTMPAFEAMPHGFHSMMRSPGIEHRQQVGGVDICLGPGSFAQANPQAMSAALEALAEWVPAASTVLDLHAGVGTIGERH